MTVAAGASGTVDVGDPELYEHGDPEAVWARLRREAPVHWNERRDGESFWAVMKYEDALEVYKDTDSFTSERGMRLDADRRAAEAAAGRMLIVTDPPRHAKLRGVVNSAFTPKMAKRLEANMRQTVADLLDRAFTEGECDFVELAAKLPPSVICDMLGVPRADWDLMLELTRIAFGSTGVDAEPTALEKAQAHADILVYYMELAEERRREPRDDIVSALVHGEVDGQPLTQDEVFLNCDGLISGGNETTRHAATGGVLALVERPHLWERLRTEPELVPTAVEEVLRWTTPGMHVLRTPVADVDLGGERIRAGEPVAIWNASANRDEDVFPAADEFDPARTPNRHLTFGVGEHYCLGGALARTELRVLLEEMLRRVERVELAGPVRRLRSNLIWGIKRMPVSLEPRGER